MQPILVTGGAGFIGAHTCKELAAHGFQPIAFDNLSRGHRDALQWGPFVQGDIPKQDDLDCAFERYQPQSVIHFAVLAYVGESVEQPLTYYQNNVSGLINVLDVMVRHGVDTIVFSSSCATYGVPDVLPIAEEALQRPISPYGHSKLMCEQILLHVATTYHLRISLLRYFNACGADPDGQLSERHDPETHLIPLQLMPHLGAVHRCRFSAQIIRPAMGLASAISSMYPISQELTLRRSTGLTTAVKRWL